MKSSIGRPNKSDCTERSGEGSDAITEACLSFAMHEELFDPEVKMGRAEMEIKVSKSGM